MIVTVDFRLHGLPDGLHYLLLCGDSLREVSEEGLEICSRTERTGKLDSSADCVLEVRYRFA
jgi:hypothetical protein